MFLSFWFLYHLSKFVCTTAKHSAKWQDTFRELSHSVKSLCACSVSKITRITHLAFWVFKRIKKRSLFLFLHLQPSCYMIRKSQFPSLSQCTCNFSDYKNVLGAIENEYYYTSNLGTRKSKIITVWLTSAFKLAYPRLQAGNTHFWIQQPLFDALPFGSPEQIRHVFGFTFQRETRLFNPCALFKILSN